MQFKIPQPSLPYILLQRTEYLENKPLYKLLSKLRNIHSGLYLPITNLIATTYKDVITSSFSEDITTEFENIKSSLPAKASNTLDIGCGIGGINILISQHYHHNVTVHLLDKTELNPEMHYGFRPTTPFYNSLELAKETLIANEVPSENIVTTDTDAAPSLFSNTKFDLVTSFISWGFHYPLSTYLDQVRTSLSKDGVLIIDIRKDSGGLTELQEYFSSVSIIYEEGKLQRICAHTSKY
jgi:SAM-dependent methyltransferase